MSRLSTKQRRAARRRRAGYGPDFGWFQFYRSPWRRLGCPWDLLADKMTYVQPIVLHLEAK